MYNLIKKILELMLNLNQLLEIIYTRLFQCQFNLI